MCCLHSEILLLPNHSRATCLLYLEPVNMKISTLGEAICYRVSALNMPLWFTASHTCSLHANSPAPLDLDSPTQPHALSVVTPIRSRTGKDLHWASLIISLNIPFHACKFINFYMIGKALILICILWFMVRLYFSTWKMCHWQLMATPWSKGIFFPYFFVKAIYTGEKC